MWCIILTTTIAHSAGNTANTFFHILDAAMTVVSLCPRRCEQIKQTFQPSLYRDQKHRGRNRPCTRFLNTCALSSQGIDLLVPGVACVTHWDCHCCLGRGLELKDRSATERSVLVREERISELILFLTRLSGLGNWQLCFPFVNLSVLV